MIDDDVKCATIDDIIYYISLNHFLSSQSQLYSFVYSKVGNLLTQWRQFHIFHFTFQMIRFFAAAPAAQLMYRMSQIRLPPRKV